MPSKERTLDAFFVEIRESVDNHAKRKNYTEADPDGRNKLLEVLGLLGIHDQHAIGEIVYKCAEFLTCKSLATKRLLAVKMAGWSWTLWREIPED